MEDEKSREMFDNLLKRIEKYYQKQVVDALRDGYKEGYAAAFDEIKSKIDTNIILPEG